MVNAWRLYQHVKNDRMPYLDFLRQTVLQIMKVNYKTMKVNAKKCNIFFLLKVHGTDRVKPGRPLVVRGACADDVRQDNIGHMIKHIDNDPVCR